MSIEADATAEPACELSGMKERIAAADRRIRSLEAALRLAADTFHDMKLMNRMLGRELPAKACEIAEQHTRAALGNSDEH